MSNVGVVYTYWSNLKKTGDMDVGQVSFHNVKEVRRTVVEKRVNEIVNRLNRSKTEAFPDFAKEKIDRAKELHRRERENVRRQAEAEKALREQRIKEKEARSYEKIHRPDAMTSNKDNRRTFDAVEDDFM